MHQSKPKDNQTIDVDFYHKWTLRNMMDNAVTGCCIGDYIDNRLIIVLLRKYK